MKLLAVVDNSLRNHLERNLNCAVDFYTHWEEINITKLPDYSCVLVSGTCLSTNTDPVFLWSIASQIRYFDVMGILIDMSLDASSMLSRMYPQIKLATYRNSISNLLLQLRTFVPDLFLDNPNFKNSTSSAAANARRFEESSLQQKNGTSQHLRDVMITSDQDILTAAPLGYVNLSKPQESHPNASDSPNSQHPSFTQQEKINESDDLNLELNDISSISSISGISEIIELEDEAQNKIDAQHLSEHSQQHSHVSEISGHSGNHTRSGRLYRIQRTINEIMLGNVSFGNLIRVITSISRMKLTGILEVQNETRSIRLEFRQGATLLPGNPQILQSALCWTSGSFNFNSSRMLSASAQPVDIQKIISTSVHDMFLFNPLLRTLESQFNHYLVLTNQFDPNHHSNSPEQWWSSCDGSITLSSIFASYGADLEPIARDIFQAWFCDEICFMQEPASQKVQIIYESLQPQVGNQDKRSLSSFGDSNPGESQLNVIRTDLKRVRASFDTEDGYSILGLNPGCGSKALDDAYYAWINRYHSDRFVRYKDPSFVKIANELLMLMNGIYAKLSKVERMNSSSVHSAINRSRDEASGSGRIGMGRTRRSTLNSENQDPGQRIQDLQNLNDIDPNNRASHRASIRPASIIATQSISPQLRTQPPAPAQRSNINQVIKMSDMLAAHQQENQKPAEVPQTPVQDNDASSQPSKSATPAPPANVTPEQHFQTAKKKLALGLGKDALISLKWALKGDPENLDYNIHKAYADFLVYQDKRDPSLEQLKKLTNTLRQEVHDTLASNEANRLRLFYPYYFTAKIQIAAGLYRDAAENLQLALKLNPTDVDTQRCIRYVNMQIDKAPAAEEQPKSKGLLAMFKDKLNKSL